MSDWKKWRENLTEIGGFENDMVSVRAGVVREMIELGESQEADAKRLQQCIALNVCLHYSASGNLSAFQHGRPMHFHGTTADESDENYLNGCRSVIDTAISQDTERATKELFIEQPKKGHKG